MFNLYFVRHGEAASSWDQSTDPGLSDLGRQQALTVSKQISEMSKPVNLVSSPLKRAQETSSPLSELWGTDVSIEPHIAEIPSDGISFDQRRQWLNMLMQSDWDGQADNLLAWKQRIIKLLTSQTQDSVFFTHFMVLNVIVGYLTDSKQVMVYRPDNCAVVHVTVEDGKALLRDRGNEAVTVVR